MMPYLLLPVLPMLWWNQPSPEYGVSQLRLPDVTGDGLADMVLSDPGAHGGQGALYVFSGRDPDAGPPLPWAADAIVRFPLEGLRATGTRLKQACDLSGDGVRDLWVEARVRRDDGHLDHRIFSVDPTNWSVIEDFRGGDADLPLWHSLGTDCDGLDTFWDAFDGAISEHLTRQRIAAIRGPEEFFSYFVAGNKAADIDGDGHLDARDLFRYLDYLDEAPGP